MFPILHYVQFNRILRVGTGLYNPILIKVNSEKSPTIQLAYFIHEKKHEKAHCEFWRYIADIMPELEHVGYIITDCEEAFRNTIKKNFPNIPLLRCWNHFYKSIERWKHKSRKLSSEEVGIYCDSLGELFLQP